MADGFIKDGQNAKTSMSSSEAEKKVIADDSVTEKRAKADDGEAEKKVIADDSVTEKRAKADDGVSEKNAPDEVKTSPTPTASAAAKITPKHKKMIAIGMFVYLALMGSFLIYACITLISDKMGEEKYWESDLTPWQDTEKVDSISKDATHVTMGTYIIDFKDMNLDDSDFEVVARVWFKWKGDDDLDMAHNFTVYRGAINKLTVIEDTTDEEDNHYQLVSFDVTISKAFWTVRFPLESHQLKMYIQSEWNLARVIFENDPESGTLNSSIDISGFKVLRAASCALTYKYPIAMGNPLAEKETGHLYIAEHLTEVEINRNGFSLYLMCFIAMFGTTIWALIALFICTYHRVDPLGMLPGALFGTVSNVMIGANKVPAMQNGLLLFMNVFGIATILSTAITIISINRIRSKYEDRAFAKQFGKMMFYTEVTLVVLGNVLMPVSAYLQ